MKDNTSSIVVNCACGTRTDPARPASTVTHVPPIVWVELQYESIWLGSSEPPTASRKIPPTVYLDQPPDVPEHVHHQLQSVLFRIGTASTNGHNVAAICFSGYWWLMDDRQLSSYEDLDALLARNKSLYPTALFYVQEQSAKERRKARHQTRKDDMKAAWVVAKKDVMKIDMSWASQPPKQRLELVPQSSTLRSADPFYVALERGTIKLAEGLWCELVPHNYDTGTARMRLYNRIIDLRMREVHSEWPNMRPLFSRWIEKDIQHSQQLGSLARTLDRIHSKGKISPETIFSDAYHLLVDSPTLWFSDDFGHEALKLLDRVKYLQPGNTRYTVPVKISVVRLGNWNEGEIMSFAVPSDTRGRPSNPRDLPLWRQLGGGQEWREHITCIWGNPNRMHFG